MRQKEREKNEHTHTRIRVISNSLFRHFLWALNARVCTSLARSLSECTMDVCMCTVNARSDEIEQPRAGNHAARIFYSRETPLPSQIYSQPASLIICRRRRRRRH